MYKVLIVDDYYYVREDIKCMLNWEQYGFMCTYTASNGKEALDICMAVDPDIVITDICMPVMDGIELINNLKANDLKAVVIVLSCFDDFNFVKSAMRNGAVDYILKHFIKKDILLEVLERARAQILARQENRENSYKLKKQNILTAPMVIDKVIRQLINGLFFKESDIFDQLKMVDSRVKLKKTAVLIIEIEEYRDYVKSSQEKEKDLLIFSMLNIINEVLTASDGGLTSYYEVGRIVVIFDGADESSNVVLIERINEISNKIQMYLFEYLKINVTIGISDICFSLKEFPEYYLQASTAVKNKIYLGKRRIINFRDTKPFSNSKIVFDAVKEEELFNFIREHKKIEAVTVLEKFHNEHKAMNVVPEKLYHNSYDLVNCIYKFIRSNKLNEEIILNSEESLYLKVQRLETLAEIKEVFKTIVYRIIDEISLWSSNGIRKEILRAIEYINKNYIKDITLDMIAELIGISKNYLCMLFKQEVGVSVIDYLNRLRIEKAKQYMKYNNMKIYEIAEAVGIPNIKYFSKLFKEMEGISPKEFKFKGDES